MPSNYATALTNTLEDVQAGQTYADSLFSKATQRQAGQAYGRGDKVGAARTLADSGNIAGAAAVEDNEVQRWKQQHDYIRQAAPVFAAAAQRGDNLVEVFERIVPDLKGIGVSDEEIGRYRQGFAQDPKGMLNILGQTAQVKPRFEKAGNLIVIFDENTGKEIGRVDAPRAPEWKEVRNPDGSTRFIDLGGGDTAPGSAPTGGAPAMSTAPGGAGGPAAPRSTRNNNPGNIEDGPFAKGLPGYQGSDGRFAIFDSPQSGQAAQGQLLASYGQRGFDTVDKIINRWAPPSDNNPTDAYASFVAQRLGVGRGQKLNLSDPQVSGQVAAAIAEFERGSGSASNGLSPTPAAPASAGRREIAGSAPAQTVRPATAAEKAAYGISEDVPAQVRPDGTLSVISGSGAALKAVPPMIQKSLIENRDRANQVNEAIRLIDANPKALGWGNIAPDSVTQRLPGAPGVGGIPTRAAVANIGSQIIHDRSGAAVTMAETPRLKPFIPSANDTPQAAKTKLQGLLRQIESMNNEIELAYGEDSGFRPMGGDRSQSQRQPQPQQQRQPQATPRTPQRQNLKPVKQQTNKELLEELARLGGG